jgi:hypothetical protein
VGDGSSPPAAEGAPSGLVMPHGVQRLSALEKAALSWEIVLTYARARRLLSREVFPEALAQAREARQPVAPRSDQDHLLVSLRLGHAVVRTLAVLPTDAKCLIRSVVLTSLLARRGIESTLVIGVRRSGHFEAHAWVEHDHRPVLPAYDYRRLMAL